MGKTSPTKIQRKHIPSKALIDLVDRLYNVPRLFERSTWDVSIGVTYSIGATFSDICEMWNNIPPKVIQAKLKQLIEQNYLNGCHCGCGSAITVIHESDLPTIRVFDAVHQEWIESQIPREYYHLTRSYVEKPGH